MFSYAKYVVEDTIKSIMGHDLDDIALSILKQRREFEAYLYKVQQFDDDGACQVYEQSGRVLGRESGDYIVIADSF